MHGVHVDNQRINHFVMVRTVGRNLHPESLKPRKAKLPICACVNTQRILFFVTGHIKILIDEESIE